MFSFLRETVLHYYYLARRWLNQPRVVNGGYEDFVIVRQQAAATNPGRARKRKISKALRDQVWTVYAGETFKIKCPCCSYNDIDPLHFECGHLVAEAAGGETHLSNLRPVCRTCNASMGAVEMTTWMKRNGFCLEALEAMNRKTNKVLVNTCFEKPSQDL